MGRDISSHDIIRGKKSVSSEGTLSSSDAASFGGNTTVNGATTIFNESTTDDVMTLDPETATENGTIEVEVGGSQFQIPIYDK